MSRPPGRACVSGCGFADGGFAVGRLGLLDSITMRLRRRLAACLVIALVTAVDTTVGTLAPLVAAVDTTVETLALVAAVGTTAGTFAPATGSPPSELRHSLQVQMEGPAPAPLTSGESHPALSLHALHQRLCDGHDATAEGK